MGGTRILLPGSYYHKTPKSIYKFLQSFGRGSKWAYRGVSLRKSPKQNKKLRIVFPSGMHRDFGARGYSDFTIHKCKRRRARYRKRHRNDPINDPFTPGSLSWWVLWGNSTSLYKNFRAFVDKFYTRIHRS